MLLLIVGNLAALASPYFLKIIIDRVFPENNFDLLLDIILSLFCIYVLRVILRFLSDYLCTWISARILEDLTTTLYDHVIKLPLSFFRNNSSGEIVHRINNEVAQIRHALAGTLINIINNAITIIGLVLLMCLLDFELFGIVSVVYPILFFLIKYFNPSISKATEIVKKVESEILGHLSERVTNIKFIKSYYTYQYESKSLKDKIGRLGKIYTKAEVFVSGSQNISIFLLSLIPLVVLSWGGWQVLTGGMTLGTLIAFLQYTGKLHSPFQSTVNLYIDLVKTTVSIERVFNLLAHPTHDEPDHPHELLPSTLKKITLDQVSFTRNNQQIINKINLSLEMGKHYAIVGPSGSGKTTLLDLLSKFYVPTHGRILVNDIDLKNISCHAWMNAIALNSQGTFLFNDTLMENIRYGKPSLALEEVVTVSKTVDLFSSSENPLDRLMAGVGDCGSKMSGGQKQKVSLARILLKGSELLLIDESTSEIDSTTEEKIYSSLLNKSTTRTVVFITHRLSVLKHADRILFLNKGEILEEGKLEELILNKGHFYKLFKEQVNVLSEREIA